PVRAGRHAGLRGDDRRRVLARRRPRRERLPREEADQHARRRARRGDPARPLPDDGPRGRARVDRRGRAGRSDARCDSAPQARAAAGLPSARAAEGARRPAAAGPRLRATPPRWNRAVGRAVAGCDCLAPMDPLPPSERATVRRLPKRAAYDRATIDAILDEALHCHLGFVVDGQPYVIPTIHARVGDRVYVHGSAASRMLRTLADGVAACLTVTLVDGLVFARSAFHQSMNYRSVVVLGTARAVVEAGEKLAALRAVVEHVVPGRWSEVRPPNERELRATSVLSLSLAEASAKIRTGGPLDHQEAPPP